MSDEHTYEGFCTHCNYQIESFEGLTCCPSCQTTSIPCDYKNQVYASINWHELRILVIWAENYARGVSDPSVADDMVKTVHTIARRIEDQHPDRALKLPLSLAGELRQVKDEFPSATTNSERLNEQVDNFKRINELSDE